jgi:hypothetical protein
MNQEIIARAGEIVAKNLGEHSHCTLALIESDGYPTISTITAAKADGRLSSTSRKELARSNTSIVSLCGLA